MSTLWSEDGITAERLLGLLNPPFDAAGWRAAACVHLHLRIGNAAPTTDREAALPALEGFLARAQGVGRGYVDIWAVGDAILIETDVGLPSVIAAGEETLPCMIVARTVDRRLADLRLYLDPAPLAARSMHNGASHP